ncbi:MAG: PsbP-related protein [Dehalococcoidia bacterium]
MKLSQIAAVVLIGIVAVFAAACGSSGTPTTGFTTYTDSINGFSISVPDGWEPNEDASGVFFISPTTCAEWYPFGAVTASYEEGYTSAEIYFTEVIEPMIAIFNEYNLVSKQNLTIDGIPALRVIYTYVGDYGESVQETFCVLISQQTA